MPATYILVQCMCQTNHFANLFYNCFNHAFIVCYLVQNAYLFKLVYKYQNYAALLIRLVWCLKCNVYKYVF